MAAPFDKDKVAGVADPTKIDDYDRLHDMALWLQEKLTGATPFDNPDASAGHGHTGSPDGVQIKAAGIADNAVTKDKIADIDLVNAFSAYAATKTNMTIDSWGEDYDPGGNFSAGSYVAPSSGVYWFHARIWAIEEAGNPGGDDVTLKIRNTTAAVDLAYDFQQSEPNGVGPDELVVKCTCQVKLSAGDDIQLVISASLELEIQTGTGKSFFCGRKLPWTTDY